MQTISKKTLCKYAIMLGPGSIAEQALQYFCQKVEEGYSPQAKLLNAGFAIKAGGSTKYFK